MLIRHLPVESALVTAVRDSQSPEDLRTKARQSTHKGHGPWTRTDMLLAHLIDLAGLAVSERRLKNLPEPYPRPGVKTGSDTPADPAAMAYLARIRAEHNARRALALSAQRNGGEPA